MVIRRWRKAQVKFLIKRGMQMVTILSSVGSLYHCRIIVDSVSWVGLVNQEGWKKIRLNSDPCCPSSNRFGVEASIQNSTAVYRTQTTQTTLKPQKLIVYKVKHTVIFHPFIEAEGVAYLIKRSGEAGSDNQKSKGK